MRNSRGGIITDQWSQCLLPWRGFFQPAPGSELRSRRCRRRIFSEGIDYVGAELNGLQQFERNNWHCHIQFEIAGLIAEGNRRVTADDMSRNLMTDSQRTGLTLPGIIAEPACVSGRPISPIAQRGPEASQCRSLAILIRLTARVLRAPLTCTEASRAACG